MKKRLAALGLAIGISFGSVSYAAEIFPSINIEAKSKNEYILVEGNLGEKNNGFVSYTIESEDGRVIYKLGQEIIGEDGNFKFKFKLPKEANLESYYMRANLNGKQVEKNFSVGKVDSSKPSRPSESESESKNTGAVNPGLFKPEVDKEKSKPSKPDESIEKAVSFKDIKNHWAEKEIMELAKKGIINGKSDLNFAPNDKISRAEITKIIVKTLDLKLGEEEFDFPDVKNSSWYSEYVKIAAQNKIVMGYSDGSFKPNDNVTREELSAILVRALDLREDSSKNLPYKDKDEIGKWAKESVKIASDNGIIQGFKGEFRPKDNASRAEAVVMIYRILNLPK